MMAAGRPTRGPLLYLLSTREKERLDLAKGFGCARPLGDVD